MEPLRADDPPRIGRYRLVARLGAGGSGRVFLAQAPSGGLVAVKVVHARFAHRQDRRERFAREVVAVRGIDPAYVAPVVDHDLDAAEPWLATEYLPGLTLRQVVELHGPLPEGSLRTLGAALARALAAIHRAGVVHRDLKPSNLVVTPDGPRVVDFGIARPEGADTITVPGSLLGTPGYIPPERIRDRRSGREGDVFALGAVLVYAATGEGPYGVGSAPVLLYRTQSEEPRLDGLRTAVDDPRLADTVARCLARDPARRPTADALVERFAEAPEPAGTGWLPEDVAASVTDAARPRRAPDAPASTDAVPAPDAPGAPDTARPSDGSAEPGDGPGRRPSRRVLLAAGGGAAAAALVALGASVPATLSAMTGTGAARRRRSTGQGPLWTYESPDSGNEHWFTRPTVIGDVVYLGSTRGVHALDCAHGRLLWTAHRGSPVRSGVAALRPGTVLFSDWRLWALRATDGTPEPGWREPDVTPGGAPAAADGLALLVDTVGLLTAYDGRTGRRRWRMRLTERKVGGSGDADRVRSRGGLDPVAVGGLVYAAPDGLVAVDPRARGIRWRFGEATTAPAVRDGVLYTAGPGGVYALDAARGSVRWSRAVGAPVATGVTVADGLVLAGDETGRLHALDAATGRPRWRVDTDGPLRAAPVAAAGTVLAGADNDRLYAVGAADGRVRWSRPVGRQTEVRAQVWRDRVVVCVDLTRLCAFAL